MPKYFVGILQVFGLGNSSFSCKYWRPLSRHSPGSHWPADEDIHNTYKMCMFIVQEELQVQTIHVNWNLIEAVHFWKDWIEDSPENPRVIPNVPKVQLSKFLRRVSELAPGDTALPELSQSPDTGWSGLSLIYQSDHERVGHHHNVSHSQ